MINSENAKEKDDNGDQESVDTVRRKDLDEMKQEIGDMLRSMEENLESGRKQDRDQLLSLQQEHKHLKLDYEKLQSQRFELSERMESLLKVVHKLNNRQEEKEREYLELKKSNIELKDDLMRQNLKHSKINNEKEKEMEELEKKLQKKIDEYESLQRTSEILKIDHEERLNRLRAINMVKVRLEGEQKEADAKLQALDRQAKEAEIKHGHEVSKLQSNIEGKSMRIEELEKDKSELAQRLSLAEKENEKLKSKIKKLEDAQRKTEDEKELLSIRLRQYDLQKSNSSMTKTQNCKGSSKRKPNHKPQQK